MPPSHLKKKKLTRVFFWSDLGYIILFSIYLLEEIKHIVIHLRVIFFLIVHIACCSLIVSYFKGPDLQTPVFYGDHNWAEKKGVSLNVKICILTVVDSGVLMRYFFPSVNRIIFSSILLFKWWLWSGIISLSSNELSNPRCSRKALDKNDLAMRADKDPQPLESNTRHICSVVPLTGSEKGGVLSTMEPPYQCRRNDDSKSIFNLLLTIH